MQIGRVERLSPQCSKEGPGAHSAHVGLLHERCCEFLIDSKRARRGSQVANIACWRKRRRRSGDLLQDLGNALLDRLGSLYRGFLSEVPKFLVLRGCDVEVLTRLRG